LPPDLIKAFGSISQIIDVDFDDFVATGTVRSPARANVVSEGTDIVLRSGDRIDLDRGVVARAGETTAGSNLEADFEWQRNKLIAGWVDAGRAFAATIDGEPSSSTPGGGSAATGALVIGPLLVNAGELIDLWPASTHTIVPLGLARAIAVQASFWALGQRDVEHVSVPSSGMRIGGRAMPVSSTPYPNGALVFVVRTTGGRFAKCTSWRDEDETLHLSYVTYDTHVPFHVTTQWTTIEGALVPTVVAFEITHLVARHGRFSAKVEAPPPPSWWSPGSFTWPVPPRFLWFWNDTQLTGSGTLPDGSTTFAINAGVCDLQTTMGSALRGVLQVEAETEYGTYVATMDLNEAGTQTTRQPPLVLGSPASPLPPPRRPLLPSLPVSASAVNMTMTINEQLESALAKGMGIPRAKVRFV
jgi:hypothetical protein